jgi:hypothetical protein
LDEAVRVELRNYHQAAKDAGVSVEREASIPAVFHAY